jgi:hypothetical protein
MMEFDAPAREIATVCNSVEGLELGAQQLLSVIRNSSEFHFRVHANAF